jgi:signal transduction histidine kinase
MCFGFIGSPEGIVARSSGHSIGKYNVGVDDVAFPTRRQYLIALGVFAGLFVASFVLFARLLVDQLSRSYLEDVLLSGKLQAEEVQRALAEEPVLYKAIEQRKETLDRITRNLAKQSVVETIQVFDERGNLAYQVTKSAEGLRGGFPTGGIEFLEPMSREPVIESTKEYQIYVPIEDRGTVVVRIPKSAMTGRIDELRRRLLSASTIAGGIGLTVFVIAVGFVWHVLQRNAHLEARRRLDEELAALGSLAANLAHEIRNPLNALSINLELLEEDQQARAGPTDTVKLARREAGRLSRLVNDFLNYARPAPPNLESIDAAALIGEVAELMRPVCERQGISLIVDTRSATLRADHGQLHQVLVNLAQNSAQALEGVSEREIQLRSEQRDAEVVLEVLDSGPGIPDRELERVKEAFYSRRKGGSGLGLAIADRIVSSHGGRLVLRNRDVGGLAVQVVLPARGDKAV